MRQTWWMPTSNTSSDNVCSSSSSSFSVSFFSCFILGLESSSSISDVQPFAVEAFNQISAFPSGPPPLSWRLENRCFSLPPTPHFTCRWFLPWVQEWWCRLIFPSLLTETRTHTSVHRQKRRTSPEGNSTRWWMVLVRTVLGRFHNRLLTPLPICWKWRTRVVTLFPRYHILTRCQFEFTQIIKEATWIV